MLCTTILYIYMTFCLRILWLVGVLQYILGIVSHVENQTIQYSIVVSPACMQLIVHTFLYSCPFLNYGPTPEGNIGRLISRLSSCLQQVTTHKHIVYWHTK